MAYRTRDAIQFELGDDPAALDWDQIPDYRDIQRLRRAMPGCIKLAKARQAKRAKKGKATVPVTVTVDQLMQILRRQNYRCAKTGIKFWTGTPHPQCPRIPTLDRPAHDGPYSAENIRVVLLAINTMRGRGTDEEMVEVAVALLRKRGYTVKEPAEHPTTHQKRVA